MFKVNKIMVIMRNVLFSVVTMYKIYVKYNGDFYENIKEDNFILISPDYNSELEFGCHIIVIEKNKSIAELSGLVCFYHNGTRLNIEQYMESNNISQPIFKGSYQIFTILDNIEEYNKIRDLNDFKKILSSINDVSYLNYHKGSEKGEFHTFKNLDLFKNVFIASKDRLKSYGSGFSGLKKINILGSISVELNNGATILFENIEKNESLYPRSIFSIVGKNGLGKSLALKNIYLKYFKNFNKIQVFSSGLISHSHFKNIAKNQDSYINVSKQSDFNYLISEILIFKDEMLSSMLFFLLSDLFSDARYSNVYVNDILSGHGDNLCVFFEKLAKGKFSNERDLLGFYISRKKNNIDLNLSSGEAAILNIVLNMVLCTLKNNGENLFIFDEPENHLHPNFISQFMNFINKILYPSNSYAVIATHSPFVVKNLTKENIVVLKQKEDLVVAEDITFNTLGANVETISQFVFGNNDLMELESEILDEIVKKYRSYNKELVIEELSKYLSSELILEIISKLRD